MISFEESGMRFNFDEGKCFLIEKDEKLRKLISVKRCECVSQIKDLVAFIEAKTSSPKNVELDREKLSYDGKELPDNWCLKTNFDRYIEDISAKFQDSFFFVKASLEGWHGQDKKEELESKFKLTNRNIIFVLIIKNAEKDWLAQIKDSIVNNLRHFLKAWNISDTSVKVVNPDLADIIGIEVTA